MATDKAGFSLSNADEQTRNAIKVRIENALKGPYTINFQFPPRITSEDKNCNWDEKDVKSYEPIAIFMGSKARTLNMEFDYIVTDRDAGWTGSGIAHILRRIKSYAYNIGSDSKISFPKVIITWPKVLPNAATCRLDGIGITYSNERVGRGVDVYPLKTTVKLTIKLATQIAGIIPANAQQGKDDDFKIQEGPEKLRFDWF